VPVEMESASGRSMMRVFLLGNGSKPEVGPVFASLKSRLPAICDMSGAVLGPDYPAAVAARPDMIAVVGGDGTLIAAARGTVGSGIPLAGVNAGKLGFLADFTERELADAISSGSISFSARMMLNVHLVSSGKTTFRSAAANDCVVRDPLAMLRMEIELDGVHLTDMGSDGVIVCTPSGSTAYNLAAGGPLLEPGISAMVLAPICPHRLTFRPLVVEASRTVSIRPTTPCHLIIDGQPPVQVGAGDTVTVAKHRSTFLLAQNTLHPAWHAMRTKLNWGK